MARYRCDNCGHVETDPPVARDLHERLEDGGVATTRECSECGALTYLVKTTTVYNHLLAVGFSVPGSRSPDPLQDLKAVMSALNARAADLNNLYTLGYYDELREVFEDCHDTVEEPV